VNIRIIQIDKCSCHELRGQDKEGDLKLHIYKYIIITLPLIEGQSFMNIIKLDHHNEIIFKRSFEII
jgi:hypothetical protein